MSWRFPVRIIDNYDGDTFTVDLDLGFGVYYRVKLRIIGIDTPEIRGGTEASRAKAKRARDRALEFTQGKDVFFVCYKKRDERDKYGRALGDLICDGESLAKFLLEAGLAVPYDGGKR